MVLISNYREVERSFGTTRTVRSASTSAVRSTAGHWSFARTEPGLRGSPSRALFQWQSGEFGPVCFRRWVAV